MKVIIAKLSAELPRYNQYFNSLDTLIVPPGTDKASMDSSSPAKNRNVIIRDVLKHPEYTHIFFTDDDQVYPPNTLMRLLSHDVDIVSGLYCMKAPPFPMVVLANPNDDDMSQFINMNEVGNPGLYEVPRVPAGCLLVKTNALREIGEYLEQMYPKYKEKWFTLGQLQPDEWADDLWFCDRAIGAGLKVHVDTEVRVGHITPCILYPYWDDEMKKWEIKFNINEGYKIGV